MKPVLTRQELPRHSIDLATIRLWELPGTIIEAMMGQEEESRIVYGPDDRVREIHGYRPPPPSAELEEAQKSQEEYERRPPANTDGGGESAHEVE